VSTGSNESIGAIEQVLGYRAAKIATGGSVSWFALDQACAVVKERWEFQDGAVSEKRVVAIIPGEPSAALFDVPRQYQEVPLDKMGLGYKPSAQELVERGRL
jgi:hypothetical protein